MSDVSSNIGKRRDFAREHESPEYTRKRQQLIRAAASVFRDRGFERTSIQDVADVLGTHRATVYYYVGSKEELFAAVVVEAVRENVEAIERIHAQTTPANQKIEELIGALMASYTKHYPVLYVWVQEDMARLWADGQSPPDALRTLAGRYTKTVEAIIEEGIADGVLRDCGDSRLIAYAIIGMLNWTHRWFKPDGRYSDVEVARVFSGMILHGLNVSQTESAGNSEGLPQVEGP